MGSSEALRNLLERGVLFDAIEIPDVEEIYVGSPYGGQGRTTPSSLLRPAQIPPPPALRLFCHDEKCTRLMDWYLAAADGKENPGPDDLIAEYSALEYRCRHTPDAKVVFFLGRQHIPGNSVFRLVGRDPQPKPYLDPELETALGEIGQDRYSKALDCRSRGFGIASLVYVRRVIEGEMDRIIDLIIDNLPDDIDAEVRDELKRLKGSRQFQDKAGIADARLPPNYFPGNQNPFSRLHDLTSDGVHNLDDVESEMRFDETRDLFEMLFLKLLQDRQTQRLYRERLTSLKRKTPS